MVVFWEFPKDTPKFNPLIASFTHGRWHVYHYLLMALLRWSKYRINVIDTALCASEVKKVEQIYSDLDNHWCLAFFLLITSGKDLWAGPENISSITRPRSAIFCAAPRQSNGSGFDSFVHLDPAWTTDKLHTVFGRILICYSTCIPVRGTYQRS